MEFTTKKGVTSINLDNLVGIVMNKSLKFLIFTYLIYVLLACSSISSRSVTLDESSEAGNLILKSTFNSVSVYWTTDLIGPVDSQANLYYKETSSNVWKTALPMKYESRLFENLHSNFAQYTKQYRGSVVQLKSNTEYDVLAHQVTNNTYSQSKIKTWEENFKVNKVISIDSNNEKVVINESGSEVGGYIVYDGQGQSFSINNNDLYNIEIDASYVIIRNFNLSGAQKHSVYISGKENTNIVIEKNNISQWGSKSDNKFVGINYNSAIANRYNNGYKQSHIVIQDNNIFNPNYSANSWTENPTTAQVDNNTYHPEGPQGITISNTLGSNVIRRNNIFSTNGNYFNDGMGSEGDNFRPYGFPGPDSDIYENSISQSRDDAFEVEGGNANVRIWNNFTDLNYVSYGLSPVHIGPVYVFKNIAYRHKYSNQHSEMVGTTFKLQTRSETAGNIYLYHNTQYTNESEQMGANNGLTGSGTEILNVEAINNAIFVSNKAFIGSNSTDRFENNIYNSGTISDIDLIESNIESNNEEIEGNNGILINTSTKTSSIFKRFKPKLGSALIDKGIVIPNFNDNYSDNAPELGANERDGLSSVYNYLITAINFENNTDNSSSNAFSTLYQGEENYFSPSINNSTFIEFSEEDIFTALINFDLPSKEFTISGWFKTTANSEDKGMLVGISGQNSYIYADILESGKLKLGTRPNDSFYQSITTSKSYNDGEWHHFSAVRGHEKIAIWVDGEIDVIKSDRRIGDFTFNNFKMKSLTISAEEIRVYTKDIGLDCIKELAKKM